ncbi:MAG: hypothetical protein GEU90_05265 [Gemmatimonas sp.]|nr:hypothetical protein [Gemmatimonas sp.]
MRTSGWIVFACAITMFTWGDLAAQQDTPPDSVRLYGLTDASSIAGGVVIPAGRSVVWTSGTGPPLFNERAQPGTQERFGDTKIQAEGVLRRIEEQLGDLGLALGDVVYIRAYLVPDPQLGGIDTAGWNEAFQEVFGTPTNPTRPARSTIGVAALVNPDWLIEVEAFAVYPE